ncbi:hypothetical protein B0H19DRAFT_853867, partial [Mycena capillaripes]
PSIPSRGDRNAPTCESTKPRELPRYFSDLEYRFTRCNLNDDAEKNSHATRFFNILVVAYMLRTCRLAEYSNTFKMPTLGSRFLYPGTAPGKKYSIADLDTLVGAHALTGIRSRGDFSEFYRYFSTISTYLITQGELSRKESHPRVSSHHAARFAE